MIMKAVLFDFSRSFWATQGLIRVCGFPKPRLFYLMRRKGGARGRAQAPSPPGCDGGGPWGACAPHRNPNTPEGASPISVTSVPVGVAQGPSAWGLALHTAVEIASKLHAQCKVAAREPAPDTPRTYAGVKLDKTV